MTKRILALPVGHMRTEGTPKNTKASRPLGNREMDRRIKALVARERKLAEDCPARKPAPHMSAAVSPHAVERDPLAAV